MKPHLRLAFLLTQFCLFSGLIISVNALSTLQPEFEKYGNAKVEWATDYSHSGQHSVKLSFESESGTGQGIVKVPYNKPFNTLYEFSCYVKYSTGLPRFIIYLDKDSNGSIDSTLISDYLDVGDNQWVVGTGGLSWGWAEGQYPPITYGNPWNPFSYWRDIHQNAIVKYIGVIRYPGTYSLDPLYVDDIIINGVTYDLEPIPQEPTELSLAVSHIGSGSVSKSPSKTNYIYGELVQLTAIPAAGYTFTGWSGDLSGSTNPLSLTINGNKTVIATFTQIAVINDQVIVSDNRCNVKSAQTVKFHFKWSHGGDIKSGSVIITESSSNGSNSNEFQINNDGWVIFNSTADKVIIKTWKVSEVNCNGITEFSPNSVVPSIIWDRVKLHLTAESERIQILTSPKINVSGFYEYDDTIFNGQTIFNDTLIPKDKIGKSGFKIVSITDSKWGLTSFSSNEVYCIYDSIETKVDYQTIIPGKVTASISLSYESDGKYYDATSVMINNNIMNDAGNGKYEYSIDTINPFIDVNFKIIKIGFDPITLPVSILASGNLIIELLVISSILLVIFFKISSARKYSTKKKELLKIINTEKSININEVSQKLRLNNLSISKMISELQNMDIKGFYSADNEYFIIEEKINDEVRKRLE